MRRAWSIALIALSLSGLAGCATFQHPAGLPLPDRPALAWSLLDDPTSHAGMVCLSQRDGDALARYFDKVDAFSRAYQRLTR